VRRFVDASVAIKWFIDEVQSELASLLLDHALAAPDLLGPECANILWKKVGRGELGAAEAETIAAALEASGIALHPTSPLLRDATAMACSLGHPAYDCFYLALAEQLQTPLVTADSRLMSAVRNRLSGGLAGLVLPLAELPAALA
jgi:predicted nucleic acid-binding protein